MNYQLLLKSRNDLTTSLSLQPFPGGCFYILAEEIKVAVEVEREENGLFSKESLCDAIKSVMDKNSEVGGLVKKNHAKWKEALTSQSFLSNYVDNFVGQLQGLLDHKWFPLEMEMF